MKQETMLNLRHEICLCGHCACDHIAGCFACTFCKCIRYTWTNTEAPPADHAEGALFTLRIDTLGKGKS